MDTVPLWLYVAFLHCQINEKVIESIKIYHFYLVLKKLAYLFFHHPIKLYQSKLPFAKNWMSYYMPSQVADNALAIAFEKHVHILR